MYKTDLYKYQARAMIKTLNYKKIGKNRNDKYLVNLPALGQ